MAVYHNYIDAYPVLKNYSTFDGAFSEIQKKVHPKFFDGIDSGLSLGAYVSDSVIIFSSIGIAYLMELQKTGHKLIEPEDVEAVIEVISYVERDIL